MRRKRCKKMCGGGENEMIYCERINVMKRMGAEHGFKRLDGMRRIELNDVFGRGGKRRGEKSVCETRGCGNVRFDMDENMGEEEVI